jgi:hypothetical protein
VFSTESQYSILVSIDLVLNRTNNGNTPGDASRGNGGIPIRVDRVVSPAISGSCSVVTRGPRVESRG